MALNPTIPPPVIEIMNAAHYPIVTMARTGNYNPSEGTIDILNAPTKGQLYPWLYIFIFIVLFEKLGGV
jgi:hypothetical protein